MKEQARQYYLDQMGIPIWYSRYAIGNAAPTPVFDFEEASIEPAEIAGVPATSLTQSPSLSKTEKSSKPPSLAKSFKQSLDSSLSNSSELPGESAQSIESSIKASGGPKLAGELASDTLSSMTEAKLDLPQFDQSKLVKPDYSPIELPIERIDVRSWEVGEWLVISEGDDEFPEAMETTLLTNIFRALKKKEEPIPLESFIWPVFANKQLPYNDWGMMFSVFQERVENWSANKTVLLVMGDNLATLLGKSRLADTSVGARSISLVKIPSLASMLRDPSNKKTAWRELSAYV